MTVHKMKVPDIGEGVVEVEIVEWYVQSGDSVEEEQHIIDLMTDKATVEITAPVSGTVLALAGEPGDMLPVGAELIQLETGSAEVSEDAESAAPATEIVVSQAVIHQDGADGRLFAGSGPVTRIEPQALPESAPVLKAVPVERPLASPAVRRRAREAHLEIARIAGTGRGGRITHQDLDQFIESRPVIAKAGAGDSLEDDRTRKLVGLRRKIATRMALSKRSIPHFSYVEEIDMTDLETLRQHLNRQRSQDQAKLTYLPFILLALRKQLKHFPQCNAHYDDQSGMVTEYAEVRAGIATQTDSGLLVPVLNHVDSMDIWQLAGEISRLSEEARSNRLSVDAMSGSTITVTSLGALGGIASTPVINPPEVAIIGVNKVKERPEIKDDQICRRLMMNLSSSFDHRIVDGHDAARMIQGIREMLEVPATLFM